MEKKAFSDAILDFDEAIKKDPKSARAFLERGKCKQQLNRKDEAIKDFNESIRLAPNDFNNFLNRAKYFESMNKNSDASNDYLQVIKLNAKCTDAYISLGNLYLLNKQKTEAEKYFDEAIKLGTRNAKVYQGKASIAKENGNHDAAYTNYTKAIELDDNYGQGFFERGELLFNKQKFKEAIIDFNNAEKRNFKSEKLYTLRAQAKIKQGDLDAALGDLNIVTTTYKSKNAELYFYIGNAHFMKNDWGAAAKDYGKAISVKPGYVEAYLERGKCYLLAGKNKYQMAQLDFNQVLKLKPESEEAAFGLGKIFFETNKYEQAIEYLGKSIKQAPSADTYYLRSKCYYKMKKEKECCNDLQKAAELGSKQAKEDIKFVCK
jgi:tetratricopeptide (TPR) repeat protein